MTEQIQFRNKQKEKIYNEWIEASDVFLHLDARKDGVSVPPDLQDNPMLTLKMSLSFNMVPTADEKGITAHLRFDGNYIRCDIPWSSLWGISKVEGEQKVWREDLPPEAAVAFAKEAFRNLKGKLFGKITGGAEEDTKKVTVKSQQDSATAEEQKPAEQKVIRKKPNLKLVK